MDFLYVEVAEGFNTILETQQYLLGLFTYKKSSYIWLSNSFVMLSEEISTYMTCELKLQLFVVALSNIIFS